MKKDTMTPSEVAKNTIAANSDESSTSESQPTNKLGAIGEVHTHMTRTVRSAAMWRCMVERAVRSLCTHTKSHTVNARRRKGVIGL
jgi:hypothetical protein